jgi:DNA-binding transcriptional MocR family regulator
MTRRQRVQNDDGADWFRHKLKWLDALALDQPTRGLAHDIGVLLVRRYLHASKGYAWISMDRLAREMGVARSSVLRAFEKLIGNGWLECDRGGFGRGRTNHYYLPDRVPQPVKRSGDAPCYTGEDREKRSVDTIRNVASARKKGSVHATRIGNKSQGMESERVSASRRDSPSSPIFASQVEQAMRESRQQARPTKRPKQTKHPSGRKVSDFPNDWIFGNNEIALGHRLARWDLAKTEDEFAKFKTWHQSKGSVSLNWPAAWETWCHRGRDYEAKQPANEPLSGMQSGLLGIKDWLDEQEQKNVH